MASVERTPPYRIVSERLVLRCYDPADAPLVGTLRFVFVMGALLAIGWLAMYALLRARW